MSNFRSVLLKTKADPLPIDLSKTVILVIDMQNDFASPGGMLARAGINISLVQKAVPATASVLAAGRKAGLNIIYLKMAFLPDLSDAGYPDSMTWITHARLNVGAVIQAPDGSESRILIRDTWNTDIVGALAPQADDIVLYKHRYSGFFETDLDAFLQYLNAKYLVVTGCTTSMCVESTVRDAMFRDYVCVVLEDCCGEPGGQTSSRNRHEASMNMIQRSFGWVSQSDAFLQVLEAVPARVE